MTIIDVTALRAKERESPSPCHNCMMGWMSTSSWIDERGHWMQETKSCQDDCERLKKFYEGKHEDLLEESL